jgi:hypothetical protein
LLENLARLIMKKINPDLLEDLHCGTVNTLHAFCVQRLCWCISVLRLAPR